MESHKGTRQMTSPHAVLRRWEGPSLCSALQPWVLEISKAEVKPPMCYWNHRKGNKDDGVLLSLGEVKSAEPHYPGPQIVNSMLLHVQVPFLLSSSVLLV